MKKRIKTAKDIKIDEIIRLAGQVNTNNKKFADPKNNAFGDRKTVLDKTFGNFELEMIRNPKTRQLAYDFHTNANGGLNITKSKVFYRQIDDKLLSSLKNLQSGKNANKTFYSWKKRQNEIIANYKPNFIDYMKGKNEELYDELTDNLGLTDDEIFDIALEAAKQGQYKESDQLISGVAKHFNLDDLVEKQVIDINKFK